MTVLRLSQGIMFNLHDNNLPKSFNDFFKSKLKCTWETIETKKARQQFKIRNTKTFAKIMFTGTRKWHKL